MGKKHKKLDGQKSVRQSSPQPESPAAARILERADEMDRRISAELAELRNEVKRGRAGMIVFSRTVSILFLPIRAVLWVVGAVFHPIASAKVLRDWFYIRRSGLFNASFYLTENPDVMAAALPPIFHYCSRGWQELRDPRPDFSTAGYLERNKDIKLCGMNPFYHYVRYRGAEPHREGTAAPLERSQHQPAAAVSAPLEIKSVPAPFTGKLLNDEVLAEIAEKVKRALYESA